MFVCVLVCGVFKMLGFSMFRNFLICCNNDLFTNVGNKAHYVIYNNNPHKGFAHC